MRWGGLPAMAGVGRFSHCPSLPRLAQTLRARLAEMRWRTVLPPALSPGRPVPVCTSSRPESLLQLPGPVRLREHPGQDTEALPSGHLISRPVWVGVGAEGGVRIIRPPDVTVQTARTGHRRGQTASCHETVGSHCPSQRLFTHKKVRTFL